MRIVWALLAVLVLAGPAWGQAAGNCESKDPKKSGDAAYTVTGSRSYRHGKIIIACSKTLERTPFDGSALLVSGDQYFYYVRPERPGDSPLAIHESIKVRELAFADWEEAIRVDPDKQFKLAAAANDRLIKARGYSIDAIIKNKSSRIRRQMSGEVARSDAPADTAQDVRRRLSQYQFDACANSVDDTKKPAKGNCSPLAAAV